MHRERVAAALNHVTPDRCPWQATFTLEFAERLRADLRFEVAAGAHNPHGGGNPYDLEMALGQDVLITSVGWANSYHGEGTEYVDEWGVGWLAVPYKTPYGPVRPSPCRRRRRRRRALPVARPGPTRFTSMRTGSSPSMAPSIGLSDPPSRRSSRRHGRCEGSSSC